MSTIFLPWVFLDVKTNVMGSSREVKVGGAATSEGKGLSPGS
jgi:hypothetical protein